MKRSLVSSAHTGISGFQHGAWRRVSALKYMIRLNEILLLPPSRLLALLPDGASSSPASLLPLTFCLHSLVSCPCYSTPPLCRENALWVISSTSTLWTCIPTRMHEAESGKEKGSEILQLEVLRHLRPWQVEIVAE